MFAFSDVTITAFTSMNVSVKVNSLRVATLMREINFQLMTSFVMDFVKAKISN